MAQQPQAKVCTLSYNGIVRELKSHCKITPTFDPTMPLMPVGSDLRLDNLDPAKNDFPALWDTGATHSVITQKVVDTLGIQPFTFSGASGAGGGGGRRPVYRVCIYLPNNVCFPDMTVIQWNPQGCDLLLGMDIIGTGDLAVTNFGGKTTFSFRSPSMEKIDFLNPAQGNSGAAIPKIGKYDPCFCGSGQQFKFCHWKA